MGKIEGLTPAQVAQIPIWKERWLKIGMQAGPVDRKVAIDAIGRAYQEIGKPPPKLVWTCRSPLSCNLAIEITPTLGGSLGDSLRGSLGDSLGDSLWGSLRGSLKNSLGDSLRGSLWNSLGDSLGGSLRGSLRGSLGDSLGDSPKANSCWFWGQHDSYWVAFYLFCEYIGAQYKEEAKRKLAIHEDLCKSCGWIYPYENICFISDRPEIRTEIRNDVHRLHNTTGPAMWFEDGWKLHYVHGIKVPEWIVEEKDRITPTAIAGEKNSEVRRVMLEFYGADRFAMEVGRMIDTAPIGAFTINRKVGKANGESGYKLLEAELDGDPDGRLVMLAMECPSTGANYVIRVPPDQTTVRGALAWIHNVERPEDFVLVEES